jgi:translocation and assembly module TamA
VAIALAVGIGSVTPSFGIWPFTRREREAIPDPTPYTIDFEFPTAAPEASSAASGRLQSLRTPSRAAVRRSRLSRARADVGRITAALYREALYSGEVAIYIDGRLVQSFSPFDTLGTSPVPVRVVVTTGDPFTLGTVDASPLPPGENLRDTGLVTGRVASSDAIVAAETSIANGWRRLGHPLAAVTQREIYATTPPDPLRLLDVEPGLAAISAASIVGDERRQPEAGRATRRSTPATSIRRMSRPAPSGGASAISASSSVWVVTGDTSTRTAPFRSPSRSSASRASTASRELRQCRRLRRQRLLDAPQPLSGGAEQLRFDASISQNLADALHQPDYRLAGTFKKPAVIGPDDRFHIRPETHRETTDASSGDGSGGGRTHPGVPPTRFRRPGSPISRGRR